MKHGHGWLTLALCLSACPVSAVADDDGDVTMTVIEDEGEATERDFVKDIELPEPAHENEARGRSIAEEAREDNQRGHERASEARQQGNADERGPPDEIPGRGEGGGQPEDPGQPDGGGPP